jgi:hypothetical protein
MADLTVLEDINSEVVEDLSPAIRALLKRLVKEGIEDGLQKFREDERLKMPDKHHEHKNSRGSTFGFDKVPNEIDITHELSPSDSTLTTTPLSTRTESSDATDVILKVNETLTKNKRKIEIWKTKTLEEVFPVLNDDARLLLAIIDSGAHFLTDVRFVFFFILDL